MSDNDKRIDDWKHHWREEADAKYLYAQLATLEPDPKRREIFERLTEVEARHVEIWERLLADHGVQLGEARPSLRARLQAWVARRFGPSVLLSSLLREEGEEVKGYLALHSRSEPGPTKDTAKQLAQESAEHAEELRNLTEQQGETWHRTESGSFLRNVVYGFNDGLTANFGLVAGVLGATQTGRFEAVLISGIAGTVADALSMGSSGYLAAKSEREVHQKEIDLERQEIALMPELETEELALLYEAKGMFRTQARMLAKQVMSSPEKALEEKVRVELKIPEPSSTPLREGWITGLATAIGAFIPVFPFLFMKGTTAIWTSFALAMLSHFAVGAARSIFTGRGVFRSGFDMFVVGMGVAGVGFVVGHRINALL